MNAGKIAVTVSQAFCDLWSVFLNVVGEESLCHPTEKSPFFPSLRPFLFFLLPLVVAPAPCPRGSEVLWKPWQSSQVSREDLLQ